MSLMKRGLVGLVCAAVPSLAFAQVYEAPTPEPFDGPAPGAQVLAVPAPDYPAGTDYDSAVATLGLDNETRCSADREGGMYIAVGTTRAAAVAVQAACDLLPNPASCGTLAVVKATELAASLAYDQCAFQDGAIDSAEIEATYEQSLLLLEGTARIEARTVIIDERTHVMDVRAHLRDERDIESHLVECDAIASLMQPAAVGGMSERVFALVDHRLAQAEGAGADRNRIRQARNAFNGANSKQNQGRHDEAWGELCRAYDFLTKATYN